jgi:TRAP-type C4-dicarboxylate transport system permease small subunit
MAVLERLSRTINAGAEHLLSILGIGMAVIVAVQVFSRYVLNYSLFWSEELARYMLVWLTFLGASVAYRRQAHPGMDVLHARMPPSLRRAGNLFVHAVSLGLFGVMIVFGTQFAWFVRLQTSPALYLPKWIILSVIPVSGVILMIHGLYFLGTEIRGGGDDG